MAFQDKLKAQSDPVARKLYDEKLRVAGNATKCVRLKTVTDEFEDYTSVEIIGTPELVTVEIIGLENVPSSRLRTDLAVGTVPSTNLYLYDILPLKIKAKFSEDLQKHDILIHQIQDYNPNTPPFYLTLQLIETEVTLSPNSVIQKEYNCAPYTQLIPTEIRDEILKEFDRINSELT